MTYTFNQLANMVSALDDLWFISDEVVFTSDHEGNVCLLAGGVECAPFELKGKTAADVLAQAVDILKG